MSSSGKHMMCFVAMAIAILLNSSTARAQLEPQQQCAAKNLSIDQCARSEADPLLLYFDDFEQSSDGWSDSVRNNLDSGSNDIVLGGYCKASDLVLMRTYQLPVAHRGLHVRATVHLIDRWLGHLAYLTVDGNPVWLMHHKYCDLSAGSCSAINVTGDAQIPDAVGLKVDVFVPHSAVSATIAFGTSLLGDPCIASFAIDDVAVSVF
jgi:hypothetical protein